MKLLLSIATVLLLAPLFVLAQSDAPRRTKPDANGDGIVDRSEAATHPRLAERFDTLDRNHDGRLAADELPRRGKHGGKRHGRQGLERLDADKDGRISRGEFDAAQQAREARRAQAGQQARDGRKPIDFAAIDANRDGYVVRSELRSYRERMRPQREAERTARLNERFAQADVNRDGKLGRVEVQEKMPRLADRFAWLDENRDGFVSRDEIKPDHGRR